MQTETVISWLVVMVGAMVQGMTGLGFGLVAVPILILFQDPKSVVVTTLLLAVVLNVLILWQARRHLSLEDAAPLTLGCLVGVPFGSYLLVVVSADSLKLLVSALVLAFSVPLLLGYSRGVGRARAGAVAVGVVSGLLHSSTGMGGPPVALFMANQGLPKEVFRGVLVVRSIAGSAFSVVALAPTGLVGPAVLNQALWLVPALLAGFVVGNRLLGLVPQRLFRTVTISVVAVTAVVNLAGNLR